MQATFVLLCKQREKINSCKVLTTIFSVLISTLTQGELCKGKPQGNVRFGVFGVRVAAPPLNVQGFFYWGRVDLPP